uniref:Uncharacterized protein n=1 Tax=Curvibacter symbiont subsp. Hydra magnipapillata TaxID=667019 RepID=C9YHA1_CURXX|nr:hypothetical protein Csp_B21510 [Curvibacter putative symbiont of Hydra magnipapillata]
MRIAVALILVTMMGLAAAEEKAVKTHGGELRYGKNETSGTCSISLSRRTLVQFDCADAYLPELIFQSSQHAKEQGQVLVIQENPMGNACNGGPIYVIGITADGSTVTSPRIDFCGGKAPVFSEQKEGLRITFPGGGRNHGKGKTPDEVWHWSRGQLKKIK